MAFNSLALHVRGGDLSAAVEQWLLRCGRRVVSCADPYDAAVRSVHLGAVQEAFIGVDWLSGSDFSLLDILRVRWPGIAISLYGTTFGHVPLGQPARLLDPAEFAVGRPFLADKIKRVAARRAICRTLHQKWRQAVFAPHSPTLESPKGLPGVVSGLASARVSAKAGPLRFRGSIPLLDRN